MNMTKRMTEQLSKILENRETTSLGEDPFPIFDQSELYTILDVPNLKEAYFNLDEIESDFTDCISDSLWTKLYTMKNNVLTRFQLINDNHPYSVILKMFNEIKPFLEHYCNGLHNRSLNDVSFVFEMRRRTTQFQYPVKKTSLALINGVLTFKYNYCFMFGKDIERYLSIDMTRKDIIDVEERYEWDHPNDDSLYQIIKFLYTHMTNMPKFNMLGIPFDEIYVLLQ